MISTPAYIAFEARLLIGTTLLVAGAAKIKVPRASLNAIEAYGIVPNRLAPLLAKLLPLVEVSIGLCLGLGFQTTAMASFACILFIIFTAVTTLTVLRGRHMNCQCFGSFLQERLGWAVVGRNIVLMALAALIVTTDLRIFSVDGWLTAGPSVVNRWPPFTELFPACLLATVTFMTYLLADRVFGLDTPLLEEADERHAQEDVATLPIKSNSLSVRS